MGRETQSVGQGLSETLREQRELEQANRHLAALYTITTTASRSLDLEAVLRDVVEKITEIFAFDATRIFLYDEQGQVLHLRAPATVNTDIVPVQTFRRGEGVIGVVAETGVPLIFDNALESPLYRQYALRRFEDIRFRFFAAFPIKNKFETLGTISCANYNPRHLRADEVNLIGSMANQIAINVTNAMLFQELQGKATELEQVNRQLEEASRAKSDFLSAMSHELRTPLHVILGYADLLRGGLGGTSPTEEQERALDIIGHQSKALLTLIDEVLTLEKMAAKKMQVYAAEIPLAETLRHVSDYVDQINREKQLEIRWELDDNLPALYTDHQKLEEILQNLIGNAYKYTSEGRIVVSARNLETEGKVQLMVSDTGIGIDESELDRIFEAFHQSGEAHKGKFGGVGLGLSIVKQYLDLMGGEISVSSKLGEGTTFTVTLARTPPRESEAANARNDHGRAPE